VLFCEDLTWYWNLTTVDFNYRFSFLWRFQYRREILRSIQGRSFGTYWFLDSSYARFGNPIYEAHERLGFSNGILLNAHFRYDAVDLYVVHMLEWNKHHAVKTCQKSKQTMWHILSSFYICHYVSVLVNAAF